MTHDAARFVHPNAFAALTGSPVLTDAWEGVADGKIPHIEAARWADLFIIAPCTAHTLAELSVGLTGSPVTMTALAYGGPLAVAPAMNTVMLESAPVREHLARLSERGVHVLPTLGGTLACGEVGEGKLTTPEEIAAYAELVLAFEGSLPDLRGKRILVSGGHTEEPLDGVRFLSNRSSGKTALAVARAARLCGADVRVVLGRAEEPEPNGMTLAHVRTSQEFREVLTAAQPTVDALVMAAAIADFVPAEGKDVGKWKDSRTLKTLELSPFPSILEELGRAKPKGQTLVGFSLETDGALARGAEKMKARGCDLMVVNTPLAAPGEGFGEDTVQAAILPSTDSLRPMRKSALAALLVRRIAEHQRTLSGTKA
jgi:phosphopantothenoylcysteine decarboxylase/phosphopantothenate--cysteine ligase